MLLKLVIGAGLICTSCFAFSADYWIDVRDANEFQQEHIKGAVNIPLSQIQQEIEKLTKNKDDNLYLYCNTGFMAAKAEEVLEKMGYKHVINEGGIKELSASHLINKKS